MTTLRIMRKAWDIETAYMAKYVGCSLKHMQFIEAGQRKLLPHYAVKLADLFKISFEDFYYLQRQRGTYRQILSDFLSKAEIEKYKGGTKDINGINLVFRALRIANNMCQMDVANQANLSRAFVTNVEMGDKMPSKKTLEKYAKVFNISVPSIIYLSRLEKKGYNMQMIMRAYLELT